MDDGAIEMEGGHLELKQCNFITNGAGVSKRVLRGGRGRVRVLQGSQL
jgi:hypothetical protein